MNLNKYIAVFSLLNAFAFGLSHTRADAGQGDKDSQRGGQAKSHMSSKGAANTNAQWSADPEKGWVRAEERHQRHEYHEKSAAKKNNGQHTAKGKKERNNEQKTK
jgi:hypothetical protein